MRLALVADIHGNLAALEAVLADLATRRADAVLNLGDCASGPLWPRDTVARLRGLGWPTVSGNHDRWVAAGGSDLGATDRFTANDMDDTGRHWLGALPPRIADADWLAIHAQPDDDNAYLTEDVVNGRLLPARVNSVAERLGSTGARLIFAAHSHLPTVLRLPDGRWIVNPGSVGCPAYADPTPPDAHVSESLSPAARYAVAEWTAGAPDDLKVETIALPYDNAAASRRAAALERPDWAFALTHGHMAAAP